VIDAVVFDLDGVILDTEECGTRYAKHLRASAAAAGATRRRQT
jgi:beta-phosphoglucomutase-like phosphatase (HAD superfamily)